MTAETRRRPQRCTTGTAAGLLAVIVALAASAQSQAQQASPGGVLGGFSRDNGPINIQADSLTISDQKKTAIYKGNVVAVQGDNTLRTIELEVHYTSREDEQKEAKGQKTAGAKPAKAAASLGEENQQIKRIKAKQKVVMTSTPGGKEAQSATSDAADYDVAGQMVELRGNVFIKQGENVICGSKVTMNLKTSEYSVERDPTAPPASNPECGRVRSVFFPQKRNADGSAKDKAATTGAVKPAAASQPAPAEAKQPTTSSWTTTSPR
jgi:lipopolysaccharide export system protein LptA